MMVRYRTYVIYRMYYGEDFIQASIESIIDYVDKVFVFCLPHSFAKVHKGRVDQSEDIVRKMAQDHEKLVVISPKKHWEKPDNQFTDLYNSYIYNRYEQPDCVILMESDMVWREDHLDDMYLAFKVTNLVHPAINSSQIEFWHNNQWRIPHRNRKASIWHKLPENGKMPRTGKSGEVPGMIGCKPGHAAVFNFGFCVSPRNMCIKHGLAMEYSKIIKDCEPYSKWYTDVWLAWNPEHNNQDLEISLNYRNYIPKAIVTTEEMPESLKNHKWNPSIFTPRPE